MDKDILRKVQLVQLDILKEVRRVCEKNKIQYYLTAGTLLGAVRHNGFIPWDDDLDIAMLDDQYKKFCEVAPFDLGDDYCFQNWDNDDMFPFEIGKVRKKNTVFIENKSDINNKPGIYIDIIVYSNAQKNKKERDACYNKMLAYHRMLLAICNYRPWIENGKTNYIKRIGYFYYNIKAKFLGRNRIIKRFKDLRNRKYTGYLFPMIEGSYYNTLKGEWFNEFELKKFEDDLFPVPKGYEEYLVLAYGDYMKLPPEDKRENRHQIIEVSF